MNAGLSEAPAADNRIVLHGLRSEEYEHSFDRQALRALKSTPGFEFLVRKLNEYSMDRLNRIRYTGSNIKLNAQVMPEIHNILFRACEILDMQFVPEMYVAWSYNVNAFTAGVERPIVVVTSGAVDLLTHEELAFLIGHELGHIKSGHVLYHQMADILPLLGSIVASATLGIGGLVSTGIQLALLNWDRMSEFTADRAGLLVCQNATTAGSVLMKAAGVPMKYFDQVSVASFLDQAREFEGYDYDAFDRVAKVLSTMSLGHPWTVLRASEMLKWIDTGEYAAVISRPAASRACPRCGRGLVGQEVFCPKCGTRVSRQ